MSEDLIFDPNSNDPLTKERGECLVYDCGVRKIYEVFKRCEKRVRGKSYTTETCEEEMLDLIEAVDHCASHKAFKSYV